MYPFFKRLLDIAVALCALVLLGPLILALALWVKLSSEGPVLYQGTRVGRYGELFKMLAGIDMVPVPYRGAGPALTVLLAGQVQVGFPSIGSLIEYVRAGKLRALAVTTATRSEALPDIPTVGEFVPGYAASFWTGIGEPTNTQPEIVDTTNTEINAALADRKM